MRRWLSDKPCQTTQHRPFFPGNIIYGENIISHKATWREIYSIERENDFPFSMEHPNFLFCMHHVALFRNTCRQRMTGNINLRFKTHLYSEHCLPLVKTFLAHCACIGTITVSLKFPLSECAFFPPFGLSLENKTDYRGLKAAKTKAISL